MGIMQATEQRRDTTLDIAKALCITLMVVGHGGCPSYLGRFIYMFHMPCFFFISGWLLSDKYVLNLKAGLLHKAKGSYLPFVKWGCLFLLCHNLFALFHFYPDTYSPAEMAVKFVRTLTMTGAEQLLGGYWFLISLFWASVATLTLFALCRKSLDLTLFNKMGGVILIVLLVATLEKCLPFRLPEQFTEQTVMAAAFYMAGYHCRKCAIFSVLNEPWACAALFAVPAVAAAFFSWDMNNTTGLRVFPYFVVAMCGTLGTLILSGALARTKASRAMAYVGSKTLYILTFHFLAFKLVSWVYLLCSGRPVLLLTGFPVLKDVPPFLSVAYAMAGVALPLALWEAGNKIQNIVKRE